MRAFFVSRGGASLLERETESVLAEYRASPWATGADDGAAAASDEALLELLLAEADAFDVEGRLLPAAGGDAEKDAARAGAQRFGWGQATGAGLKKLAAAPDVEAAARAAIALAGPTATRADAAGLAWLSEARREPTRSAVRAQLRSVGAKQLELESALQACGRRLKAVRRVACPRNVLLTRSLAQGAGGGERLMVGFVPVEPELVPAVLAAGFVLSPRGDGVEDEDEGGSGAGADADADKASGRGVAVTTLVYGDPARVHTRTALVCCVPVYGAGPVAAPPSAVPMGLATELVGLARRPGASASASKAEAGSSALGGMEVEADPARDEGPGARFAAVFAEQSGALQGRRCVALRKDDVVLLRDARCLLFMFLCEFD